MTDKIQEDIISQIAETPEQEARMRGVLKQVGHHVYQLLLIARGQNAQKLATIHNHNSIEARRAAQFIFAADAVLGIIDVDALGPEPTLPKPNGVLAA